MNGGQAFAQQVCYRVLELSPFAQGAGNLDIQSEGMQSSGDLAYDWGKFTDSTTNNGHYLVVLRKAGGKWRLAAESTFAGGPPASK